jgi:hypothetical protein
VLGLHGWWVYIAPTPVRALLAVAFAAVCFAAANVLHGLGRSEHGGWGTYAILLSVALIPLIVLALEGRRFLALVVGLLCLLLLGGSAVGLLTRWRTKSDVAGYVAFAVVVGYVPGVWFGGLL